ncbi:MAG: DUF993 family protein [Planctomycetota bacterium]|nr:MAG: DUF993 family protein [Planctomycetota bacterium]
MCSTASRSRLRALAALGAGDFGTYRTIMRACEAFGRVVFEPPTQHYKVGLAFLAHLNGHQPNAMLANHAERCRTTDHLCGVVRAAAACGAIADPAGARAARSLDSIHHGVRRGRPRCGGRTAEALSATLSAWSAPRRAPIHPHRLAPPPRSWSVRTFPSGLA